MRPASRLWKWARRCFIAGLALLVLIAVFHRPLLLGVLRWAGPRLASGQGLPLKWQVQGSLWSDLELKEVQTGGGEAHWLPRAQVGELKVEYDWRAILRRDYPKMLRSVKLHEAEVELDLRNLPPVDDELALAKSAAKSPGGLPPALWPRTIDLRNVNATVTLADGGKLIVRGFTLQIGEGMPGVFACEELRREPDGLMLERLSAQVMWETYKLTLSNLRLPNEVTVEQLEVNLTELWSADEAVELVLKAGLGKAKLAVKVRTQATFQPTPHMLVTVSTRGLRAESLHGLGLPGDVKFEQAELDLTAEGNPLAPVTLQIELNAGVSQVGTPVAEVDEVAIHAQVREGKLKVSSAKITRVSNVIEASAEAVLPADLAQWQQTPWKAQVKATLPGATQFLVEPPPLTGSLQLKATAEGLGATPKLVRGELLGHSLVYEIYQLPPLRALFSLNGQQVTLEMPTLSVGEGNTLDLKAVLQMQDAMPVVVDWELDVPSPETLLSDLRVPPLEEQLRGHLLSTGHAEFHVQDIQAQKYERVLANLDVKITDAAYGTGAAVPELELRTKVRDGSAEVEVLRLTLDEKNGVTLTSRLELKPPYVFQTRGDISLPEITRLNGLLRPFGVPEIRSGGVTSVVDLTGQLQPWQARGRAELNGTAMQTASMTEKADIALKTTFEGTRAVLDELDARLGPWHLSALGTVDEREAHLTKVHLWQKEITLLNGHVRVPLDLMKPEVANGQPMDVSIIAKAVRLNDFLTAAGLKDMPAGVLDADIQLTGRLPNATGQVLVTLSELKIPQGPRSFQPATVKLEARLKNQQVKTHLTVAQPPLKMLTLDGELPLDLPALLAKPARLQATPLRFSLRLPESDLSFLREYAADTVRTLPARLMFNADVSGTVGDPRLRSVLNLDVSEITWTKPDLPSVRDVRVRLTSEEKSLRIEDVSVVLAGGRVKLTGNADLKDMAKPGMNLTLEAREALVFRDPTTSLRANADITCRGDLSRARVEGLVEIVRGRIFKEIDLLPVLKLPADVPAVPPDTSRSEATLKLPPLLKDWTFNVQARTRDPLLISGNLANGAIAADVRLSGIGADPQLNGGASIERFLLKLPFSTVKITKGVVTLRPEHPFDPDLNIRGESRMGSNDITLYVYGDSTNPKTRFSSSPPMSESDIVTLLATGTTLNGSPDALASEAATRAAFLFITEFYRKTFKKKKVIREEPPRLNLTFNPSGADRSSDSVQATYDLTENWRVTGRFTQTGRMKALLGYVLRFGKAAQAMDAPQVRPPLAPPLTTPSAVSPTP